jgi:hypothetical protein
VFHPCGCEAADPPRARSDRPCRGVEPAPPRSRPEEGELSGVRRRARRGVGMTENPEPLEAMLAELKGERASVAATMTKEDVARTVDEWLAIARARAAGSSGSFLGLRCSFLVGLRSLPAGLRRSRVRQAPRTQSAGGRSSWRFP